MGELATDLVRRGRAALDEDELPVFSLERIIEAAGEAATQLAHATRAQFPEVDWRG